MHLLADPGRVALLVILERTAGIHQRQHFAQEQADIRFIGVANRPVQLNRLTAYL